MLLERKMVLVIAGHKQEPGSIQPLVMKPGRVYNVRRDTSHTALPSRDSLVPVVETRDTGAADTQRARLSTSQRSRVQEIWEPGG